MGANPAKVVTFISMSVYILLGQQVFLVISKINVEFLNPLYRGGEARHLK